MKSVKDEGIVTQLAVVATMMPKVKEYIDQQADRIAELEKELVLKTRDRDVFCDFTMAYEKRIEELEKLEQDFIRVIKQTNPNKPQAKPLSDEEIDKILESLDVYIDTHAGVKLFVRAIEERHGIK